ncbi:transposase, partial [Shigella sonnei]
MLDRGGYGFAPIFPDICYHLTHYKPAAADIPV